MQHNVGVRRVCALPLHLEALLHCISGLLALPVEGVPMVPVELDSLNLATAILARLPGVMAFAATAHLLPHRHPSHLRTVTPAALRHAIAARCRISLSLSFLVPRTANMSP